MRLSQRLWLEAQEAARRSLEHPFVQGLGDGTLDPECYRTFIAQDAFYLEVFARAYGHCAERASDENDGDAFRRLREGSLAELRVHRGAAEALDIDLERVEPLPSTLAYTGFLERCIDEDASAGVTAASMAPCMRLYAFVGQQLDSEVARAGRYADWVTQYAAPEFEQLARMVEDLLDRSVGEHELEAAGVQYHRAMQHEYDFFDGAWRAGSP